MLVFENLNVSDEIKSVLKKYQVDFAFQPIYNRQGELFGHEALLRPQDCNVLDFIEQMKQNDRLHDLELLSYFGATMKYRSRDYQKKLCINSFPSECFTVKEAKEYSDCFKPIKDKLVIEILEYTEGEVWKWRTKQAHTKVYEGIQISLDDFGTGNNDTDAVDFYSPQIVKLDRILIEDIDKDEEKQEAVKHYITKFHEKSIEVLAEGIETKEEYEYLLTTGIEYFQGYYLGRPE